MSAQPDHLADSRVPAIPHTINAIGDALSGEQRARFYGEVLAAEEDDVAGVMRRWWKAAMLDRAPRTVTGRSADGRRLIAVEDLLEKVEGSAG
ncbi:hypothetical protein ACFXAZ_34490 [Streptomyces sp. NPDC059477]|uniref:hypothetical protein n=1 Tax=Streptomyces sp. NPDC059477 TaxID=3346847 RepID=UPI003695BF48